MEKSNKVVCIADVSNMKDPFGRTAKSYGVFPVKSEIYTVVNVTTCNCGCNSKMYYLEEIPYGWDVNSFRPVDEQFGADVCSRIEKEFEHITVPLSYGIRRYITEKENGEKHGMDQY